MQSNLEVLLPRVLALTLREAIIAGFRTLGNNGAYTGHAVHFYHQQNGRLLFIDVNSGLYEIATDSGLSETQAIERIFGFTGYLHASYNIPRTGLFDIQGFNIKLYADDSQNEGDL